MLNLKHELKSYIDSKSIDFGSLYRNVRAILAMPEDTSGTNKIEMEHGECNYNLLAKFRKHSELGFAFTDNVSGKRMKLLIMKAKITNNRIFVDNFHIDELNAIEEVDAEETPMWVEKKWYRKIKNGKVYRWLGKKSYDTGSPDNKLWLLKEIEHGSIEEYPEEKFKGTEHFEEMIPEYNDQKQVIYRVVKA